MERVDELEKLSPRLSPFLRKGIQTNSFLMPERFRECIREGKLFLEESSQGVLLVVDRGPFYQLYYYLKNFKEPFSFSPDKPAVMEILWKERFCAPEEVLSFWEAQGYHRHIVRRRMAAREILFSNPSQEAGRREEIRFGFGSTADIGPVGSALREAFDPYTGCVPCDEKLRALLDEERILCARDSRGDLLGVLHFGVEGRVNVLWHLLVLPRARGLGLAKRLLARWAALEPVEGWKGSGGYRLFVMADNRGAIGLYEKAGFQFDGISALSLLKAQGVRAVVNSKR